MACTTDRFRIPSSFERRWAGRGYGPTHSQDLEKHFVGIAGAHGPGHARAHADRGALSRRCASVNEPVLIIENKLLYRERYAADLPSGYTMEHVGVGFETTVLRPRTFRDITVVAFGRMSVIAERVAARLAKEEEIYLELVMPLEVSPLDSDPILESVARTGKVLVIEEGTSGFDLPVK